MTAANRITSDPLPPDAARKLVKAIERLGVDANAIDVEAIGFGAETTSGVRAADQASVARPAKRATISAIAGAVIGLLVGALLAAITSVPTLVVVLGAALVGAVLGALGGLYGGLAMSTEVYAVDTGAPARVTTRTDELDADLVDKIRDLTNRP